MKKGIGRREEKELSISVNQFRDLAEKSLVGIYLIQDWVFKYVNKRFSEIFGYSSEELIDRMGPKDLTIPEDWHIVEKNIYKRISGEFQFVNYEFRGITKDRRPINVEGYGSRTTHRRKPAVIGTLLDITRRKRAEATVKEAERKYRSIFDNALEGIFQTTPQGRMIAANPALARIMGYDSPEEVTLLLTNVRQQIYVDPEKRSEFEHILEEEGSVRSFECEFYKKDGTTIWVSMNARRVRDENDRTLYYEGSVADITQTRKAAEEILALNKFNKTIIDNSPLAIFTVDKHGRVASTNPALGIISGLEGDVNKLIGYNWLRNSYSIGCGLAEYIKKGLQGKPFQLSDFPFVTYSGDKNIFMEFKGVPLREKNEDVVGLLCIIEETTDKVRIRSRLAEEAKMSAIGRLAAGIAHELSNPLATLVTYTELASRFLDLLPEWIDREYSFEELKSFLDIVEDQAFRCKNLIGDVLSLSRQDGLETSEIDINQLLENIVAQREAEQLNVKIVREFYSPLPPVRADLRFLRQVFVNLINNGIDAVEDRENPTIWIRTRPDNTKVRIEIEDNGGGIPGTIADKIFEPFFTTKGSKRGLGLGLSLCYEFLLNMGGTIETDSRMGHGTTFLVTIHAG